MAFIGHLDDGSAERAFGEDLETTRRYGARGFPTFVLRYRGKEVKLPGYRDFQAMRAVIDALTEGEVQGRPPASSAEDLLAFLRTQGRAAPVELEAVFELSSSALERMLDALQVQGRIRRVQAGNGCFWEPQPAGAACEASAGICGL